MGVNRAREMVLTILDAAEQEVAARAELERCVAAHQEADRAELAARQRVSLLAFRRENAIAQLGALSVAANAPAMEAVVISIDGKPKPEGTN